VLRAALVKRYESFQLEAELQVERGGTLVLVGESGAGKSTVLRLLAGLEHPDGGRIEVDGRTWFDSHMATALPPWRRDVGYVPQDYALFPHLSVFDNVSFGLGAQGLSGRDTRARVSEALARLQIVELERRAPAELSGGQRQRVALARALVTEPRLLLLDEPLSALDLQTRRVLRGELRRLLSELPCVTIYVTHAPLEATAFGEHIIVLEQGRASQSGTRDDLLRRPKSAYIAEFMGMNLFHGRIAFRDFAGFAEIQAGDRTLSIVDPGGDEEVFAAVGPREVTLHLEPPAGSALNVFEGPIEELVPEPPFGERLRVSLATRPPLVAEVTRHSAEALKLSPGQRVYASFKATAVITYR
jgi:molybdate transport system ATP-binding protein